MQYLTIFLWITLLFSTVTDVSAAESRSTARGDTPRAAQVSPRPTLLGYLPSYRGLPDRLPRGLTHLIYAFAIPTSDGHLAPLAQPEQLRTLRQLCDRQRVKLGILIGGWMDGDDSAFETLSASQSARQALVGDTMALIREFDLDGVELDWEYPDPNRSEDNFAALVAALAKALHGKDKFLGLSLPALGPHAAAYRLSALERADYYTLMAYDSGRVQHASLAFAEESILYWHQRLLPLNRALLGIPAYSRPSAKSFKDLVAENWQNAYRDAEAGESWNGIPTARAKVRLAMRFNMGTAIWEIGQDTGDSGSLTRAVADTLSATSIPQSSRFGDADTLLKR